MTATSHTSRTSRRARTGRRGALAVLATATALGATAFAVPAHAADAAAQAGAAPKAAPKFEITDGTLDWGVKDRFRKYLTGPIARGKIEVADGAKQAPKNGPFTFTGAKGSYDSATHAVATTFKGSVRFLGHQKPDKSWELDIRLADLKVTTDAKSGGEKGGITADVTTGGKTQDDVPLAALDLSAVKPGGGAGGAVTYAKIPAKLTAAGAKVFQNYEEGEALDSATLSVKVGAAQKPATGGKPGSGISAGGAADAAEAGEEAAPRDTPVQNQKQVAGAAGAADVSAKGDKVAAAGTGTVSGGNLDWGVKEKFRKYVTGPIAKGKAELSGGAQQSGSAYRFVKGHGSYDASASSLDAAFDGAVRFTGHEGKLDLKLSDLRVKAKGTTGTLTADVSTKELSSGNVVNSDDLPLATLKLPAGALTAKNGVVTLSAVPATLTQQGAKVFENYEAGEALDPVTLSATTVPGAKPPAGGAGTGGGGVTGGTGSASLAATGADTPTGPLLGAAGALLLAGGGAIYATRRRKTARG
ncbi:HtaA domain-containing protein [Streptomyces albireticuli]|uniref:Htaa domain-containing protein n=1 Tax=Streptomyces albireticuli TaxID=1940 RepID=A0A2A2D0R9_9ACTN|nr:HtaA domain-containing protein [Streptomyces albireticuli]MCD9142004.1 HtaA domain-containing protein [Streptomyces albireticuli]MCD9163052.1 HtaA domain-containing protein [Streptomyces albireticuli]MCD9190178.1 HtaA domain-containing protein [Streptomyces albireticuli]PAU45104.1 hypothetical protein CK936_31330 [Streptomyces albireticuli]